MPRSSRYRLPTGTLPRTLQRSCPEAQACFLEAHQQAIQVHGESDQAYRAAYDLLKEKFAKRGDYWIPKAESAA